MHGWRKLVEDGELVASRKNGTIVVSDHTGRTLARFTFTDAWPSRVSIDTDPESGLANETIVLAVETLARE